MIVVNHNSLFVLESVIYVEKKIYIYTSTRTSLPSLLIFSVIPLENKLPAFFDPNLSESCEMKSFRHFIIVGEAFLKFFS